MIVDELIRRSLRLIGATATGETPSADEFNDAFSSLNDIIESWANERLIVRSLTLENFTPSIGQTAFTMGPGGTLPLSYTPVDVLSGYYSANGFDTELVKLTQQQYDAIGAKGLSGGVQSFYVQLASPLLLIKLYPAPGAQSVSFRVWKPVAKFTSIQQTLDLPPGWQRALSYALAQEIGPEYGQGGNITIATIARDAKANIKRANTPDLLMRADPALLTMGGNNSSFSIWTGQ